MTTLSVVKTKIENAFEEFSPSWYGAAVGAVFVAFALCCFREIANWWQFGHNGFNGSTYMRAAINSIRFGLWGQVKYYQGLEAPGFDRYFVHHPLLLHVHMVPLVAALGREPWVGRLLPAIYSILNMGMLFVVVRRYFGRREALLSIVIFLLLPINLVYANMIDHVQGAIFSCLLALFFYLRWRETLASKYFWLTMLGITLAVQWEWVGYFLALFLVVHAFACGLRRSEPFRWHPEYTFVFVFSVVVLGNAAAFFGYAHFVRGGLQELIETFNKRSSTPDGYWSTVWSYSKIHYGLLPLGLLALWLAYFFFRLVRGELKLGHLLAASFFGMQVLFSTLFPDSGSVHSYWIYYLGVAIAAGGAEVLGSVHESLRAAAKWVRSTWRQIAGEGEGRPPSNARALFGIQTALFALLLAVPVGTQTAFAWRRFDKGVAKAGIPKYDDYDPQTYDAIWARALGERFSRESTTFVLHEKLDYRSSVKYYLDAPIERRSSLKPPKEPAESDRRRLFLVDMHRIREREKLNELVQNYGTLMYNRRYLAIDLTDPGGPFEAHLRVEREPSILWSWFVNGRVPPGRWRRDSFADGADVFFPHPIEVDATISAGGDSGAPFSWHCPSTMYLRGFEFVWRDAFGRANSGLRPVCAPYELLDSSDSAGTPRLVTGPVAGGRGRRTRRLLCDPGGAVVGIHGRAGRFVDALGIVCGHPGEAPPGGFDDPPDAATGRPPSRGPDAGDASENAADTSPRRDADVGVAGRDSVAADSRTHSTPDTRGDDAADASSSGTDAGSASAESEPERRREEVRLLGPVGSKGGEAFEQRCPPGTVAWLVRGRAGALVDSITIGCVRPPSSG